MSHLPATALLIADDDPEFDEDIPTISPPHRSGRAAGSNSTHPKAINNSQSHHGERMSQNNSASGTCHARGCDTPCTGFMCEPHWKRVPPAMRLVIESSPNPHAVPPAIATAAVAEVAHRESRTKPAVRQKVRRHPVQLALFGDDQELTKGKRS
ncbi:hypothetical protein [Mycolicibacterium llatzerense]|uniref:Uncharacterized protein n=1 Tax=Mycolicibacterium llatzerense TaxID=280871 RepID=A0A0D1IZD6_9MYCO|nr:hypothetical protein [Mycolicibacterium llatzerense]KIU14618.1 hypothetical protein TL10_23415 [Mycolicibacterium llatzerense]MCT7372065.1 hypothetical protein [Mycolicibacterium llatzerense]